MNHSLYSADRLTYRRTMAVGLTFCTAFVAISFFARDHSAPSRVLVKADKLVRTAGQPLPAN